MSEGFWAKIERQLNELKTAKSADDVILILQPTEPGMASGDGFFEGSGGDETVADALGEAGWRTIWRRADYYWAMAAPDGQSTITYIEGDVYRGNRTA
jgi:hypothetical protein